MIPALPYREQPLQWQGLHLRVRYTPCWFAMQDYSVAHLEIHSEVPLPMTETGYRSHFMPGVAEDFDPVAYVTAWLDETAKSPQWQDQRQGCLF